MTHDPNPDGVLGALKLKHPPIHPNKGTVSRWCYIVGVLISYMRFHHILFKKKKKLSM